MEEKDKGLENDSGDYKDKNADSSKRKVSGIARVHVSLANRKVKVIYKDQNVFKSFNKQN